MEEAERKVINLTNLSVIIPNNVLSLYACECMILINLLILHCLIIVCEPYSGSNIRLVIPGDSSDSVWTNKTCFSLFCFSRFSGKYHRLSFPFHGKDNVLFSINSIFLYVIKSRNLNRFSYSCCDFNFLIRIRSI